MEVLVGIVVELVKGIWVPISQCWTNHKNIRANMATLNEQTEFLNKRREDIERRLNFEHREGKVIESEVELWLKKVKKIIEDVQALNEEFGRVKFVSRAKVSSRIVAKSQEVEKLYEKGVFPNGLVGDYQIQKKFPPIRIINESTTMKIREEIWAYLMNTDIYKIGVHGMGGSGKTTVMREVYKKLWEDKEKFGLVIWVTASKAFDVRTLQLEIAREFGLDVCKIEEDSDPVGYLYSALEQKGRYVLILDDLWEAFRLHDIGIPDPTSTNKLVLTTRSRDICLQMGCQPVEMAPLTKDEARDLFLHTVGDDTIHLPNIKDIAYQIADECALLPLAVITVAGSMKGKTDLFQWNSALVDLRRMQHDGMKSRVLPQLEFSYIRLKDDRLKNCLLFCALYPEDWEFEREKLVDDFINQGIIKGLDNTEERMNKGLSLLKELVDACLLEEYQIWDDKEKYVKMHDLIREMAIQKMNEKAKRFLVKSGDNLSEIPDDGSWPEELEKASLMNNKIKEISSDHAPMCPNLSTLMLAKNPLVSIAYSFFTHFHGLTYLDLSDTKIEHLPNSLSDLDNLTVLLLQNCRSLTHVPSLAKLTSLKKLDISYTGLKNKPEGSEMLTNLKSLDLTWTNIEDFPVINMSQLTVLRSGYLKCKAKEVARLKKLEILVCMFSLEEYTAYVREYSNKPLYKFSFCVTNEKDHFISRVSSSFVKCVHMDLESDFSEQGALVIPKDVQCLSILHENKITSLSDIPSLEVATGLKELLLERCDNLQCLFFLSSSSHHFISTTVVALKLYYLNNLRSLVAIDSRLAITLPSEILLPLFNQLNRLEIRSCPNIKEIFLNGALWALKNLAFLSVWDCESLEQIIATDNQEKAIVDPTISSARHAFQLTCLPNLRELRLRRLPELKSICPNGVNLNIDSLVRIIIAHCPKLKRIPISLPIDENGELTVPSSLQDLFIIPRVQCLSLEWDHPNARNTLEKRFKLLKLHTELDPETRWALAIKTAIELGSADDCIGNKGTPNPK